MVTRAELTDWATAEDEDEAMESGMEESPEDKEKTDELATKYGGFMEILENYAQDLQVVADQLDDSLFADLTTPLTPEQSLAMEQALASLDEDLVSSMVASVREIPIEDAEALAQHCVSEGYVDDPEALKNFVFRVGQLEE